MRARSHAGPSADTHHIGKRLEFLAATVSEGRYSGTPGRIFYREDDEVVIVAGADAHISRTTASPSPHTHRGGRGNACGRLLPFKRRLRHHPQLPEGACLRRGRAGQAPVSAAWTCGPRQLSPRVSSPAARSWEPAAALRAATRSRPTRRPAPTRAEAGSGEQCLCPTGPSGGLG
ncbi:hypothetical protein AB0D12_22830 [Streptomyces sp. NPDC048479]|uniref:hypothetical protein n=1 Tax=Streptomyces sp. NPDC048479 TaxID=3154725 RepID=UPI003414F7A9